MSGESSCNDIQANASESSNQSATPSTQTAQSSSPDNQRPGTGGDDSTRSHHVRSVLRRAYETITSNPIATASVVAGGVAAFLAWKYGCASTLFPPSVIVEPEPPTEQSFWSESGSRLSTVLESMRYPVGTVRKASSKLVDQEGSVGERVGWTQRASSMAGSIASGIPKISTRLLERRSCWQVKG